MKKVKFKFWDIESKFMADENGKEIYEGDIVKFMNEIGEEFISEVIFIESSFCVSEKRHENELFNFYCPVQNLEENIEIIGNIYENKELLYGAF